MVKPRKAADSLQSEFAGGLLPGLTSPLIAKSPETQGDKGTHPQGDKSTDPLGDLSPKPHRDLSPTDRPGRHKVAFYLDAPRHLELIDEILSLLRKTANLPRDQSMLIRALLDQAQNALDDPGRLQSLAQICAQTLPNR